MNYLMSFLCFVFIGVGSASAFNLPSKNFFKRGFKHCTGYCDSKNIKCEKGIDKQGYYDWCEKNCLHSEKKDKQKFIDGLAKCNAADSGPSPKNTKDTDSGPSAEPNALPEFTKPYLGKIIDGKLNRGFKVQIVAQKESGGTVQSGEYVFLHDDKIKEDMKIGDYIQMGNITPKEYTADDYGKMKMIKDSPTIVK